MTHVWEIAFRELLCRSVRARLDAYLDGELLIETNLEILLHFRGCHECRHELECRAQLRRRLKAAVREHFAPAHLAARVRERLRDPPSRE
ncbi:MAG: putative transrane anti-sigma factor [Candidatus Solibacter sp.]|nr:putative transrane anti-sigma factor [Candidatus Solibacter sp.]